MHNASPEYLPRQSEQKGDAETGSVTTLFSPTMLRNAEIVDVIARVPLAA